jgi:hypothetical protein
MQGSYRFDNLKFLKPHPAGPVGLDYRGQVVVPKVPGKLKFTSGVARRVGGHEQCVSL